ncbi:MAG: hypothetical protein HC805_04325 [Alkalinema sp. RL_2_19]|nr:hypothetical protein [Alkalinema sp. RL_2_19]
MLQAQQLNIQATLALNLGQPDRAYQLWQQAETQYHALQDQFGIQLSQLNQAQALQNLGHYRQARTQLERLQQSLNPNSAPLLQAKTLLSLGTTLQMLGELDLAETRLTQSQTIAQTLPQPTIQAEILLQLAQLASTQDADQAQPIDRASSAISKRRPSALHPQSKP